MSEAMPDAYRVVLTTRSSADLQSIHEYVARTSEQNAALVVERLLEAMDHLTTLPHRYPVVSATKKPCKEMRMMPVRPFLVYYRVIESDKVVLITTVVHGARQRP